MSTSGISCSSSADMDGPPDAKRYCLDLSTTSNSVATSTPLEASIEGQSPAAPSSASYRSSNASVVSSSSSPVKEEESDALQAAASLIVSNPCDLLDMLSKTMFGNVFDATALTPTSSASSSSTISSTSPPSQQRSTSSPQRSQIPGALAVAQSPAAQLFAEDDWSWHRNPAASIRSGGTNKQTPVWKYFVYNKAENLSRCIVGDCTYMLKGPHTSTLACHLKKHTKEYAEFQKLKVEYSRSKMEMQQNSTPKPNMISSTASTPIDMRQSSAEKEIIKPGNKVPKKEVNGTPPGNSTLPQIMQSMMMSYNPLQMMLAQTLPVPQQQQQPTQKRARQDDKKQKEIQMRWMLALATSHVSFDVVRNPAWKELFETMQTKCNVTFEPTVYENYMNGLNMRLEQMIKSMIAGTNKLNVLVDVSKNSRITIGVAIPAGTGNSYETQVVLLVCRALEENCVEEVQKIYNKAISDYGIQKSSINRVVCSGLQEVFEKKVAISENQIDSFAATLSACLNEWIETSATIDSIRKDTISIIFSIITNPQRLQSFSQKNGGRIDLPLTAPLGQLVETVLSMKDLIENDLDEQKWSQLEAIQRIIGVFKPFMAYSNDMLTIDTVIPTIQQILNALDKDVYQLGEMASELSRIMNDRLKFIMDTEHEEFDSTFVQATSLSPQLVSHLTSEQLTIAQTLIEREVNERRQKSQRSKPGKRLAMGVDSILANVIKSTTGKDISNDAFSIYGDLLHSINNEIDNDSDSKENIVGQYFDEITNNTHMENLFAPLNRVFGNPMQAPLAYWKSCSNRCSQLADYASELLSIPVFTLTAERVLPSNQISPSMDDGVFEKQLLLKFNRSIVAKIL